MIFQIILILIALALLGAIGFGAYLLLKSLMKKQSSQTALPQFKSKLTLKLFAVAIVGLLSLIPLGMIQDLSQDRESLYRQVVREIGHTWGDAQTLAGPVLVLPFRYEVISDNNIDGKQHRSRQVYSDELLILPKGMTLDAGLQHEFRHRGIYQSLVYLGQVKGRANFELPKVNIPGLLGFDYNQARLVFGVSANQAIETVSHFNLAGEQGIPSLMSGTGLDNTGGLSRNADQLRQIA
ncbi:inner membrane CreD family protein [Shewanella chilikensis]|uniref:inner membrane CreD family protein n=1 Tax=Shewanella chilikensis TaxID=558541 RepID=UPI00399A965C